MKIKTTIKEKCVTCGGDGQTFERTGPMKGDNIPGIWTDCHCNKGIAREYDMPLEQRMDNLEGLVEDLYDAIYK